MYNLEDLMKSLESDMEKSASEVITHETKDISDELAGILTKKANHEVISKAQAEGEALAAKFLEKMANEINTANAVMQAEQAAAEQENAQGTVEQVEQELVDRALSEGAQPEDKVDTAGHQEKTASENGEQSVNTIMNKIQEDNAAMDAQADAKVQPLPASEGTANQIIQAIVAKAQSEGSGEDILTAQEGAAVAVQPKTNDEVEKAAAVASLVESGFDFDSAVQMVKEAEEAIKSESLEQEKQAAFSELLSSGISFDKAIELVKQAEEDLSKEAGALALAKNALPAVTAGAKGLSNKAKLGIAAGGAAAVGGAVAASRSQEKRAAFEALSEAGIDFDTAVELIKQAEQELYGEE